MKSAEKTKQNLKETLQDQAKKTSTGDKNLIFNWQLSRAGLSEMQTRSRIKLKECAMCMFFYLCHC